MLAQDERLTRRVGAATLVVLALSIVFFVFVYDQIEWGSRIRVRVYFHTTGGLQEGAVLVVGGQSVGHVEAITLVPRGTPQIHKGAIARVTLDDLVDAGEAILLTMIRLARQTAAQQVESVQPRVRAVA